MSGRRYLTVFSAGWLLLVLLACTLPGEDEDGGLPDAEMPAEDGAVADDAAHPEDGGVPGDADIAADGGTSDATVPMDAGSEPDGGAASDAGLPDTDAGLCGLCEAADDCETATCTELGCERVRMPDGTGCTSVADGICVSGTCVARGCGDGYREPGPSPAREGCDDGNTLDGDACDSTCTPSVLVVASRDGGEDWPSGPAPSIGVDGRGELLFVWTSRIDGAGTDEDTLAIHARRYGSAGVARPTGTDPLVIDSGIGTGWPAEPTVAGLTSGGWVVVWTSPTIDGDLGGIAFRIVEPDGTLGPVQQANEHTEFVQHEARVAALSSGFVIVWTDESGTLPGDPGAAVRARLFDTSGAVAAEQPAAATRDGEQWGPTVASAGDDWLVAWTHASPGAASSVRARRFRGAAPTDSADLLISGVDTAQPSAAAGPAGFGVVWTSYDVDPTGDLSMRIVPFAGPPGAIETVASTEDAELLPTIAMGRAMGVVLGWQQVGDRRGAAVSIRDATAPPELVALAPQLRDGLQGDLQVVATQVGAWVLWSDAGALAGTAYRAVMAYLLFLE